MVDVQGRDALKITTNDTDITTIVIPVHLTGAAATPENISKIVNRDNTLDLGGSSIKLQVVATDHKMNGVLNEMDFSPGADKKYGPAGEGAELGGKKSHINSTNPKAIDAAAHDILHFAGITDQYKEGSPDANGNRTSTPKQGYDNSNIMTSREGTKLKPEQIREAEVNRSTKKCTVENGKTKCH